MRKEIQWSSAYGYIIVPKAIEEQEIQLSKLAIYDDEDETKIVGYDSIKSLADYTDKFNPFQVIDERFIACRFPLTAKEIVGMATYLKSQGLVDIADDGTDFGITVEDIDFTNVPDNGFMIAMVHEMKDVPRGIDEPSLSTEV